MDRDQFIQALDELLEAKESEAFASEKGTVEDMHAADRITTAKRSELINAMFPSPFVGTCAGTNDDGTAIVCIT